MRRRTLISSPSDPLSISKTQLLRQPILAIRSRFAVVELVPALVSADRLRFTGCRGVAIGLRLRDVAIVARELEKQCRRCGVADVAIGVDHGEKLSGGLVSRWSALGMPDRIS